MRTKRAVSYTQHGLLEQDDAAIEPAAHKRRLHHQITRGSERVLTWSYGGGTQSIALAVLIVQGKLPRPALTVFCDTGREASETWEYTERYVAPLLASVGVTIEVAPHNLATVDLYGQNGDLLLPVYTATGKFPTYCSEEWKKRVFRRFVRSKGIEACSTWLGISTDEIERLKASDVQWQVYHYPLCDYPNSAGYGVQMGRAECRQLVQAAGLPDPPKSSCYLCPHRRNAQWLRLKQHYPEDFHKAVEQDRLLRERDPLHAVYLHESRQPLDEVDFSQPDEATLFGEENGGCSSGFCFI